MNYIPNLLLEYMVLHYILQTIKVPSSFNVITINDFIKNFEIIKKSLQDKAGSTNDISYIEIYRCLNYSL